MFPFCIVFLLDFYYRFFRFAVSIVQSFLKGARGRLFQRKFSPHLCHMNEELTRRMPFSLEAEQAVLGSILIDPACMDDLAVIISRDDFYMRCSRCI